MSEDSSLPGMGSPPHGPPVPSGHEPPPIPERHVPPPLRESKQQRPAAGTGEETPSTECVVGTGGPTIPARHEPPPIPQWHKSSLSRASHQQPTVRPPTSIRVSTGEQSSGTRLPAFLSQLGLLLVLACVPFALFGAFFPTFRSPFWLAVLVFAFVANSLEKFARDKPNVSADLVRLSLRLSYGFLIIALIGLIAAAFRASIYISHVVALVAQAIHGAVESWHESNGVMAWFLHKADAIARVVADYAHSASAAPSPTPTATPPPG